MENQFRLFEHPKFGEIRVVLKNGDPLDIWFSALDTCHALELGNVSQALTRLDEDELTSFKMMSGGQMREMKFVNEPGLYRLIFSSRKKEAKEFQRWVYHEVLPSIRKHGYYSLVSETKPVAEKPKKNQKRVDAQNSPARVYVFLLVASSFFVVKIGMSKDLETRKKAVERETNATVCHIYKTSLLPRKIARLLEKLCKEYFSSSRLSGEYFFADYDEVCKVLNMLEKMVEALPSVNDHVRAEELLQIADTMGNTPERKNILIEAANIIAGKKVA